MSKTNVHKIAEDLYAASASLAEKVRGTVSRCRAI